MIKKRKYSIALIGDSPDVPDWKEDLIKRVDKFKETFPDDTLEIEFLKTINPSLVPFVSVSALGAQTVELIFCREQLLAAQADITILIDSGISNETLKRHTERIANNTKTLIAWAPPGEKIKPISKDEIALRPGVMCLVSSISVLAFCVYFLMISDEASCLIVEDTEDVT